MGHTVEVGAARIAVDDVGEGPAVVLVHAGVADHRSWREVVPALAERFRTIAYDQRGYGATTYRPEPYVPVGDLVAVLDALAVDTAVLVGNSQGGHLALEAALRHPPRVRGLVLIGPAAAGAPRPDHTVDPLLADTVAAIEAAEERDDVDEVNRLEAQLWLDGPGHAGRVTGAARGLFLDMNGRALRAEPPGEPDVSPVWPHLESIEVPTLVLVGDLDARFVVERSEVIAQRIPGARLERLPGLAHLPQLEAPGPFLDALLPFLTALPH